MFWLKNKNYFCYAVLTLGAADFKELFPEFYEGDGEYTVHTGVSYFL